ncbi:MAG: TetR/AcrR family transcriptional regulator [Lachnospiraceae bacterium]|nr:TetR/AcrR family transcriptional regulator [Lachnospiraceae bacterium]
MSAKKETVKTDRRILRTKKAIKTAFAELLARKSPNEITVTELAKAADINRKTFYNYYSDIYQVMDEIEDEIVTAFENALQEVDILQDIQTPYCLLEQLTDTIDCDLAFYTTLLRTSSNSQLIDKIIASLKSILTETFASYLDVDARILDMVMNYTVAGIADVYRNWVTAEERLPISEMYRQVSLMTFEGLGGILKNAQK